MKRKFVVVSPPVAQWFLITALVVGTVVREFQHTESADWFDWLLMVTCAPMYIYATNACVREAMSYLDEHRVAVLLDHVHVRDVDLANAKIKRLTTIVRNPCWWRRAFGVSDDTLVTGLDQAKRIMATHVQARLLNDR